MGKSQRKHNWKGRQQQNDKVDVGRKNRTERKNDDTEDVLVEANESGEVVDDCNAVCLPSRKRKGERTDVPAKARKLSKKERKRLEHVVKKKEKKLQRAELLDSLANFQTVKNQLTNLKSSTEVFSGRKKVLPRLPLEEVAIKKKQVEEELVEESNSSEDEEIEEIEIDDGEQNDQVEEIDDGEQNDQVELHKVKGSTEEKVESIREKVEKKAKVLKPVVHVPVMRTDDIQKARLRLPILAEEQVVMETINEHPVTVICGETGSGKTTQVPQFLYEAGYARRGLIAVTEPRRIAAISMSHRVGEEMNLTREVSYQIRYEGNTTSDTRVQFMTDGVLLKAIQTDFLLSEYSVVVIDEAHERSAFTDILIGLLSRIVPLREKKGNPLKFIIMSATLRVEDFTANSGLFKQVPPVVKVESRQYPVTIHFNRVTPENYVEEAFRKVSKIHQLLPEGGILVFVTGQKEVNDLCKRLKRTFPANAVETKEEKQAVRKIDLAKFSIMPVDDTEMENDEVDEEQDDAIDEEIDEENITGNAKPLYVLPLYSLLPSDRQKKVFGPVPEGVRLCVVATNVAETSLTIPNVKYVVDTGKVKTKFYDKVTGVSTFQVTSIAKSSADQRAGRAGRTGPGHCYRLYSSAVFTEFEQFAEPEIVRRPVDDLILQMKELHIEKVANFPFPTPPAHEALLAAEQTLIGLGALEKIEGRRKDKVLKSRLTSLGKVMACFPVAPRYGKMLALAQQHNLLGYAISIVSALSVQELFVESGDLRASQELTMQTKISLAGVGNSLLLGDLMVLLKVIGAFDYENGGEEFCERYGLRHKAMLEIRKLRQQLTNTVNTVFDKGLVLDPKAPPPSDAQTKLLRQIVLAGAANRIARRLPEPTTGNAEERRKLKNGYKSMTTEDVVFIHPKSVLYKKKPAFVVYQEMFESKKLYMRGVAAVEPKWLPIFAPQYAQFSKPAEDPAPRFDGETVVCHRSATYGPWCWEVPQVEVPYPEGLDRFRWFAQFLMDGKVFKKLARNVPDLLSKPQTMVKTWAKLQPRTESLLKMLAMNGCYRKSTLVQRWTKEPRFLLTEYLEWIPEAKHAEVERKWPPL